MIHIKKAKNRRLKFYSRLKFKSRVKLRNDEWFFVLPYGIGDLYLFLSLFQSFQEHNNAKNICVGILKQNQCQLLDIFPIEVRMVMITEKELEFCESNIFSPGIPFILHPIHCLPNSLLSLIGYKNITLNDIYKIIMNVPMHTVNQKPIIKSISIEAAEKRFIEYNLEKNKTVLIAPHANSFEENIIPFKFWEILNDRLQSIGFKVICNSKKKPFVDLNNILAVDFPLKEAIPFVEKCGFFIGIRSGLCDLISSSSCNKYILYPKLSWYSGSLFTGSSLRAMGLSDENILEFELDSDSYQNIIDTITNNMLYENQ